VEFWDETAPDRWETIAKHVPGKSAADVWRRYEDLVHDVREIESGRVVLPSYKDDCGDDEFDSGVWGGIGGTKGKVQRESERRKGVPWTEEEHKLFLIGLQRYGKGDWRSISRNAVVSRTPTQVASHAQKYFLRLNSIKKDKKRSSIHDITTAHHDTNSESMAQIESSMEEEPSSFFTTYNHHHHQAFGFA
jgi:SHAQKYF class myb-like DNA-binding protein